MKKSDELQIRENITIKEAMRIIDRTGLGTAFIIDKNGVLHGTVTDGDIRDAIMNGVSVEQEVQEIMYKDPITLKEDFTNDQIIHLFHSRGFSPFYSIKIPVINEDKKIKDIVIYSLADNKVKWLNKSDGKVKKDVNKILVVGGAGYLGSVLCRKLLAKGFRVRVLDLLLFGEEPIAELKNNPDFELIHGDMRNISTLTKSLKNMDAVIHLAAIVGDPASKKQPVDTIEINYLATMTLAQACKYNQINRFIFASTCSVYGVGDKKLDENSKLNPVSLYARAKIESERGIISLADENFSPTIMRMGTLYGLSPRMRFDLVVNIFSMMASTQGKITVFGGDQWRPLLNVSDAADAYIKCLEAPIEKVGGEIFNVGSEEQNYQIKDLAEIVKKTLPDIEIEMKKREVVDGELDARDYMVSFEKIESIYGFKPVKTVDESIMEIHNAIETGMIKNVNDPKYYNVDKSV